MKNTVFLTPCCATLMTAFEPADQGKSTSQLKWLRLPVTWPNNHLRARFNARLRPAQGGWSSLSDDEVARVLLYLASQSF